MRAYLPCSVRLKTSLFILLAGIAAFMMPEHARGENAAAEVKLVSAPATVEAYDFAELTLQVPVANRNPFTTATLQAVFTHADEPPVTVEGFCDSEDGRTFRARYMPAVVGEYTYALTYTAANGSGAKAGQKDAVAAARTITGKFTVTAGKRKGPVRVDVAHPWHFVWEGTGEHYLMNGTTAFWLMGWKDDATIDYSIDRLARLQVNRMRVLLSGRTSTFYGDAVMNGRGDTQFDVFLPTWPAKDLTDFNRPEFDYTRFDVKYWQRFDAMLRHARDRDMVISVLLDIVDSRHHVKDFSEEDKLYVRYAVARLSAYSNITWDMGDDCDTFHTDAWTHDTGTYITTHDPVHHLATSHPVHPEHQDRAAAWFGFTSFQEWSRKQHEFMLGEREQQKKTGRIIPQSNEEYGYEDHYPLWAEGPGSESADTLRRTAWEIYMAGGYQTAGETARRGTNVWPDSGGGWINGRGDDTMTMFLGYGHIVEFLKSFDWWKTDPHDELVTDGAYCLAEPGQTYAVYLPRGGTMTAKLPAGHYSVMQYAPQTGQWTTLAKTEGGMWTSPETPRLSDWAFLLRRIEAKP